MLRRDFLRAAGAAALTAGHGPTTAALATPRADAGRRARRNHTAQERLLVHLWAALDRCAAFLAQHRTCGPVPIDCPCSDLDGMQYTLELFADVIEAQTVPFAAPAVPLPDLTGPGEPARNHPLHVGTVLALLEALDAARELAHEHRACARPSCVCADAEGMAYDLDRHYGTLRVLMVHSAAVERLEEELERRQRQRGEA